LLRGIYIKSEEDEYYYFDSTTITSKKLVLNKFLKSKEIKKIVSDRYSIIAFKFNEDEEDDKNENDENKKE
jgi:hypothetical protein